MAKQSTQNECLQNPGSTPIAVVLITTLYIPNSIAGINAKTTIIIVRFESRASCMCTPDLEVRLGTNKMFQIRQRLNEAFLVSLLSQNEALFCLNNFQSFQCVIFKIDELYIVLFNFLTKHIQSSANNSLDFEL